MTIRLLVIEVSAISLLQTTTDVADEWFESFGVGDDQGRIWSGQFGEVAVIGTEKSEENSRLLIVRLGDPSFFSRYSGAQRREILRRMLVATQSMIGHSVDIPYSWRPFRVGSRISFNSVPFSSARATGHRSDRVEVDNNPFGKRHIYVYNCSEGWNDIATSLPDRVSFDLALQRYISAIATRARGEMSPPPAAGAITLTDDSFYYSENTIGFEEWVSSRLTAKQSEFVGSPEGRPVRLRGAAGTGKTLALAVKVLASMKGCIDSSQGKRILFLTHSASTCVATESLIDSLDRSGIKNRFLATPGAEFSVSTLLDLAMGAIGQDLQSSGILPISTDALEGRRLQLELIESIVINYRRSGDWQLMRQLCSEGFTEFLNSANSGSSIRRVCWELMNEFACVLDADGVQQKPELRKRYVAAARMAWMLPLNSDADRRVVLALYDKFNAIVAEMNAISVDQLIADYLNYLDSFRWNAVREKRAFDLVFVDELHLFNRQERMAFHGLARKLASPSLYLAYDPKQSPSDTFMPTEDRESSSSFWSRLGVGGIEKVELDKVFRYSPEIARFIQSLDQTFPALDLGDDWGPFDLSSAARSAHRPSVTVLKDEQATYKSVMGRAHAIKRRGGEKYSVAVLCCNPDTFATFRDAGEHKAWFRAISSRDEAASARPDAFRFLLSTPDYVAGLQFDCVLLLDMNRSEVPDVAYSAGLRRRFISTVYLGASRAMGHLELYAHQISGGRVAILDSSIEAGTLVATDFDELPTAAEVAVTAGAR